MNYNELYLGCFNIILYGFSIFLHFQMSYKYLNVHSVVIPDVTLFPKSIMFLPTASKHFSPTLLTFFKCYIN